MATYKGVYFCESDPDKWFDNREDAERFDKVEEVSEWAKSIPGGLIARPMCDVISHIMERYEINQRWDWKEPAEDVQE